MHQLDMNEHKYNEWKTSIYLTYFKCLKLTELMTAVSI